MSEKKVKIFKSGRDGRPMVKIPAGEFLFGEDKEKAKTGEYYIDQHPVTNAEYKKFIEATGHSDPAHWRNGTWPSGKENHPVVEVNYLSALAYAQWAGKRLPTNLEWEKAARGTDGRTWPWGNEFDRDKCNTYSDDTTPVGQYSPAGDSLYGCVDMAGNVWEWVDAEKASSLRAPLRGGDWLDGAEEAKTYFIRMHTPHRKNPFIGFRCAADNADSI